LAQPPNNESLGARKFPSSSASQIRSGLSSKSRLVLCHQNTPSDPYFLFKVALVITENVSEVPKFRFALM
jgi:hypothetical protein